MANLHPYLQRNSLILLFYSLITAIMTYPAIKGMLEPYNVPGTGGDTYYFLWHIWWLKEALLHQGVDPTQTQAIFHPLGGLLVLASPITELVAVGLQPWLGVTRTMSVVMLMAFPLTAFTTYLLAFQLSHHRGASLVGGVIFAFSTYHLDRFEKSHLGLNTLQYLPLYALALFLAWSHPTRSRLLFLALSLWLAILSEHVYYLFYFTLPFTLGFILWQRLSPRPLMALLVGGLCTTPAYVHLLFNRGQTFLQSGGVTHYAAELGAYLTPTSRYSSAIEHDIFIGWLALGLAGAALYLYPRRPLVRFWGLVGGVAFIFSFGPLLRFNGLVEITVDPIDQITTHLPLPYIFLTQLPFVSMLRAPARLAVTVQLAIAILATVGLARLTATWPRPRRVGVYLLLLGGILFEAQWPLLPHQPLDKLRPPDVYTQIAQEHNSLAVLEIPSRTYHVPPVPPLRVKSMYLYMYYATIHRHPLVGGETARSSQAINTFLDTTLFLRELIHPYPLTFGQDIMPTQPLFLLQHGGAWLAQHRIGYVVLHRDLVARFIADEGEPLPEQLLRQALGAPFYDDGQIVAFRVPATPMPADWPPGTSTFGDGWYPQVKWQGELLRWATASNSLLFVPPLTTTQRLQLAAFPAMQNPISVTLTLNGQVWDTFEVPLTATLEHPYWHTSPPLTLLPQRNELQLQATPLGEPQAPLNPLITLGVTSINFVE